MRCYDRRPLNQRPFPRNQDPAMLAETAYGKSRVRLVKLSRHGDRHDLKDLTIAVRFEGDYDQCYTEGDNDGVLPTDTMKNTVYALAADAAFDEPEELGLTLSQHFVESSPKLRRVRIDITEHPWGRIAIGVREHGQAFVRQGSESRLVTIQRDRGRVTVGAGVADLVILKSSKSAFTGFLRDKYTTLPETTDRIFATSMTARWQYRDTDVEF